MRGAFVVRNSLPFVAQYTVRILNEKEVLLSCAQSVYYRNYRRDELTFRLIAECIYFCRVYITLLIYLSSWYGEECDGLATRDCSFAYKAIVFQFLVFVRLILPLAATGRRNGHGPAPGDRYGAEQGTLSSGGHTGTPMYL